MVHENSKSAYDQIVEPTKETRKQRIISVLKEIGEATMLKVADYMGVPLHTISGRFGELQKDNKIQVVGTEKVTINSMYGPYQKEANVYSIAA